MSLSICAITGQPLKNPVVSSKTGHLFEKEVIDKHLLAFPYCPITNVPMSIQDLIVISNSTIPMNRQDQSPVTYLSKIQTQYDLLAVDMFTLRKCLKQTEDELSSTLYQNEAASRVIARLLREKEETQAEIQKLESRVLQLKKEK